MVLRERNFLSVGSSLCNLKIFAQDVTEIGPYTAKQVSINNVICCKREKTSLFVVFVFFYFGNCFMGVFVHRENSMADCRGNTHF